MADPGVPISKFPTQRLRIAGGRPRFLHLPVRRHEPDEIDERSGAQRIHEEVLALAEPHQPALGRPFRHELARNNAAVGHGPGENRTRLRMNIRPQRGVDPVRADHEIAFGGRPVFEGHTGAFAMPLESGAPVSRMHDSRRQRRGQHVDEVRPVHAVGRIPPRSIRDLHACDHGSVVMEILRPVADFCAPLLDRRPESHPLQLPHAVRRDVYAGSDFSQGWGLLVNRYREALRDQGVCRKQAADAAADDDNVRSPLGHGLHLREAAPGSSRAEARSPNEMRDPVFDLSQSGSPWRDDATPPPKSELASLSRYAERIFAKVANRSRQSPASRARPANRDLAIPSSATSGGPPCSPAHSSIGPRFRR